MAKTGKIYYVDVEFTDAQVAAQFAFPCMFFLRNAAGEIKKHITYDQNGVKSVAYYSAPETKILTLGAITATTTGIAIALHSSGVNAVEIVGNVRSKTTPENWTFPAVVEEQLFTVYAVDDPDVFHLAMPGEEVPVGALIVRSFLISEHGVVEMNDDFKLYVEDAWRNYTITSNDVFTINMDNALAVNFAVTVAPGVTAPKIGLIRQKAGKSFRPGVEFKIRNFSAVDIALVETAYTDGMFKHLTFEGGIAKKNMDTLLKEIDGAVSVLNVGGGGAEFPEGGVAGNVLEFDSVDGAKWSNRLTNVETNKQDKSLFSSLVDKMVHYFDEGTQKMLSTGVEFISAGILKVKSIILTTNSGTALPNELGTDGTNLHFGTAKTKLAFDVQVVKIISGNVTLDDSYHNTIVRITANCIIEVPSTLRSDFNMVFDVVGTYTATFVEGSSTTFSAPFGKIAYTDSMGTIYKTSSTNYRLRV